MDEFFYMLTVSLVYVLSDAQYAFCALVSHALTNWSLRFIHSSDCKKKRKKERALMSFGVFGVR